MLLRTIYVITLLAVILSFNSALASDAVRFGGFVDSYFGYDFKRPSPPDRSFTTQPARHNEFNVNLAFIDANLAVDRVHGRLALQAGTSVQSNYAGEPTTGVISGGALSRHLQEAYAGYRVLDSVWIDAGIYFSHLGWESFISRDNMLYTRSILSDFSPYYQSGARATIELTKQVSAQLHLINGWQNISENGSGKAVGTQLLAELMNDFQISYNNFFGTEVGQQYRFFNDLWLKYKFTQDLQVAAIFDMGIQQRPDNQGGTFNWWGAGVAARYQVLSNLAFNGRVETFSDPDQVIIATGKNYGYTAHNASVGVDVQLHKQLAWRNEVRYFVSSKELFAKNSGLSKDSTLAVTSLGLTF